jgi:hypothetical protein
MNFKLLFLLGCAYTTNAIRLIYRSNNIECLLCNEFVPYLKEELNNNTTETLIVSHLEEMCGDSKDCQFLVPMLVNHCIDYLNDHSSDQLCDRWCSSI